MSAREYAFIDRFAAAFGRPQATLLKLAGFASPEVSANRHLVRTADGREWVDWGSFGLHLLGHRHPAVCAAVEDAVRSMGLSSRVLGNLAATDLVEAIKASTPWELDGAILANTGAEAVEAAIKMAMIATGRSAILALQGGYHGRSIATASLGASVFMKGPGAAFAVERIAPNDQDALARALAKELYAAVVVEPIQGEGGIVELESAFLERAYAECRRHGTTFVVDEIQTGLGRTGTAWAAECAAIQPDVLLTGKVLGGGFVPISAALYSRSRFSSAATDPLVHSSSFAGGSLACKVAKAAVSVATSAEFLSAVGRSAEHVSARLDAFCRAAPFACTVRGRGLMLGLELAEAGQAGQLLIEAAKNGLLLTFCLSNPKVLRLYPPGVMSLDEIDRAIDLLDRAAQRLPPGPHSVSRRDSLGMPL